MSGDAQHSSQSEGPLHQGAQPIHVWEAQYPDTWILLEITEEDEGEPISGLLLATATNVGDLQDIWRAYNDKGVLTMLTYGCPSEPHPKVVICAT